MAAQFPNIPAYPGFQQNSQGELFQALRDYQRQQMLNEMVKQEAQRKQQSGAGNPVLDIAQHEALRGVGSTMIGGASEAIPTASYNIPASYLPTQAAPEIIGTMADGSPMYASGSSASGMTGFSSVGVPAAVALGTYLSGKDAINAFKGKEDKSIGGKVGRAQNAFLTMGGSEIARALFGQKSTKQKQQERDDSLKKLSTFTNFRNTTNANAGAAKAASDAAAADFVGFDANGVHVNNKFKNSRNVKDLTVNDITGSQAYFEDYGDDWLGKKSLEERNAIAQSDLDQGLIDFRDGMIFRKKPAVTPATQNKTNAYGFKPAVSPAGEQPTMIPKAPISNDPNRLSPGVYKNPNGSGTVSSASNPWRRK